MDTLTLLHDLLDERAATAPDSPAVASHTGSLSYGRLADASRGAATALRAKGVGRGARVLVKTENGLATASAVYGASRLGALFSVLHADVRGAPLEHVLQDSEPTVLVTDDADAARTAASAHVSCLPSEALLEPRAPGQSTAAEGRGPLPVDPVCLLYTSGTTALPKAVVSTHQQLVFATRAIQERLRYRPDDLVYCPLPLSFDYGLYQLFLAAVSGAEVRLGSMAEAGPPLLRALRESGATVFAGVPSVSDALAWLLRRSQGEKLSRLRLLTNTGAALSEKTRTALRAGLPNLSIQLMYGLTECKRATIMPPDGDLDRPGSSGVPLPGTELTVVDDDGAPLPPGATGEIVVRGPHVMSGYWRRPELTARRFPRRDGLFPELRTGDYGHLDEEGYLYFSGRHDDLYKERGFRVSCTEVEAAALRLDGVTAAVVLPPAGDRGAVLTVVGEVPEEEVLERMREQIERFKVPRRCVRMDSLPTNGNGKFDRRLITARVEGRNSTR